MYKSIAIVLAAIVVSLSAVACGSETTTGSVQAVTFTDATHGWAVGASGTILATTDGGATWRKQTSGTTANLSAVTFPDATHGWVVDDNGTILATTDGGAIWSVQRSGSVVGDSLQ